jgi:cation:H+ antiporter
MSTGVDEVALQIGLALVGLVLLTFAADHLVLGSSRTATRLRIGPVVVGVVVIGLGTSAPELLVSGVAAARRESGIALGNITGSNIFNLTLILGIAGVISSFAVASPVVRREVRTAVAAVAAFGLLAWLGLTVWAGAVLAVGLVAAIWLLLRWAAEGRNTELAEEVADFADDGHIHSPAWREPVRAVLGLAGVLAGAQILVANASAIAEDLGVPQLIIGLTLVAVGTSLPELVTTVQAMRRGETDLVVGNLFGSNLFNSLGGGAIIAFAKPSGEQARISVAIAAIMVLTAALAWALLRRRLVLTRFDGAVLLAACTLTIPVMLAG